MKHILVVDDEFKIRKLLRAYLEREGYEVSEAQNGLVALELAQQDKPDLIILDLMMPEMNGYDFLRAQPQIATIPIIMLTARDEESDEILGLELGADDYVTKPVKMRSLMARVRAMLRRNQSQSQPAERLRVGEIVLDRATRQVRVRGELVALTPSEFELLCAFLGAPGRVFSRLDLLEQMSGDAYAGYERTVDVHIRNLRRKIEIDPAKPRYIETAYGVGYRLSSEDAG